MKKKILAAVLIIICAAAIIYYVMTNRNKTSHTLNNNKSVSDFRIKSAFADVDLDMVVQDKDLKDEDTSADYIFINFTNEVTDNKKNDDSNPVYLKSYTLNNSSLPSGTKIYIKDKTQVIIKLKDGSLKGLNAPHSITISKKLLDKQGKKIKGDLNLKLPYSNDITDTSNSTSENKNNNSSSVNNSNNKSSDTTDKSGSKNNTSSNTDTLKQNSDLPKYTVELGKAIPYTTVIMVILDTPNPENYKINIEGIGLELKENSEGKKVFVGTVKKTYELEQVKKLIKIEKVQK